MFALRVFCLSLAFVAATAPGVVFASEPSLPDSTPPVAPAFAPMPIPQLLATASSPDRESAARAITSLFSHGRSADHALLRLLESGTTQDGRIALYFRDRPMEDAIPALLAALERHDDGTSTADYVAQALRTCVPSAFAPPPLRRSPTGSEEDPRGWRDWARRHRRSETAACLGRSTLSVLPFAVMLLSTRRRREPPR